jgi:hypothetical protein
MKKITLLIASLATLFLPTLGSAQIVSVDFQNSYGQTLSGHNGYTGSNANYTAGTTTAANGMNFYVQNWNDFTPPGGDRSGTDSPFVGGTALGGTALKTSTGGTSDIGFTMGYNNADNTGATASNFPKPDGSNSFPFYQNTGNANAVLAGAGVSSNTGIDVTFAGLSTTDNYSLIAYVSNLYFGGASTEQWSIGGQTLYTKPTNSNGLTGWVGATGTSAANANYSNFVEFNNLTTATGILDLTGMGVGSGEPAIMGFQIVDTGAGTVITVPEPSTVWMFSLGFLGLMAHVYRRRYARV